MKLTLSNFLMFAAGAAIGSAVTWKLLSIKFEERFQEELRSTEEAFRNLYIDTESEPITDSTEEEKVEEEAPVKPAQASFRNYAQVIDDNSYSAGKEETDVVKPYVIPYEDFGERDGYDAVTLTYYADGVLTDEDDNPIEDVEGTIGDDPAEEFKRKERDPNDKDKDSIYMRNDDMETDFEILRDYRSFASVTGYNPHSDDEE